MKDVVIVSMARTAIGDFQGGLKELPATELGKAAAKAALDRAGIQPEEIQDCTAGVVYKAGAKGNPARQIQLELGIPAKVVAATIEQQCASSMRALEIVAQQIQLGYLSNGLICGIESMSRVPYLMLGARNGFRMGDSVIHDGLIYDALHDAFLNYHMGITAETLAEQYGITREQQDEWAYTSHKRAVHGMENGWFEEEIVPVVVKGRKGEVTIDRDEHPKADISREKLAALRPAFKKDGTVTAGNASSMNDGASAMVIMEASKAEAMGISPIARLLSTASCGVKPEVMGIGPVDVIPIALERAGKTMGDIDYFEINEAFAAQFLACNKVLGIPEDQINYRGSGISLGHPVGSTGLRLIISALQELKRRGGKFGVASLCAGGGPAMAAVVELL